MTMGDGEGFLSRWSRRKVGRDAAPKPDQAAASADAAAQAQKPAATAAPAGQATAAAQATPSSAVAPMVSPVPNAALSQPAPGTAPAEAVPLPTLDDVAKLTRDSDYSPFVNRAVDPNVRNAAMKKLFSDPHFNVMDGLDTYIDDYGKPDPLPLSMLRQMSSARALGLFAEEEAAEAKALAGATAAASPTPAADYANPSPDAEPPAALAAPEPDDVNASQQRGEPQVQADAAVAKVDSVKGGADPS